MLGSEKFDGRGQVHRKKHKRRSIIIFVIRDLFSQGAVVLQKLSIYVTLASIHSDNYLIIKIAGKRNANVTYSASASLVIMRKCVP